MAYTLYRIPAHLLVFELKNVNFIAGLKIKIVSLGLMKLCNGFDIYACIGPVSLNRHHKIIDRDLL